MFNGMMPILNKKERFGWWDRIVSLGIDALRKSRER